MKKMIAILLCVILTVSVLLPGCSETRAKPQVMVYYSYFDTVSCIYSYAGDPEAVFSENAAMASRVLEEYHRLFDIYNEYAGVNNLCTVNRMAGGAPVEVDRKLIDFMCYAAELYTLTGGKMNVMMGAVTKLWHDRYEAALDDPSGASIPDAGALAEAGGFTDFSLLEIDVENCTLRIATPRASLDVGAIGKGYATEQAARKLRDAGVTGYVLDIGGNIRILGEKPDGSAWLTGVRDPADPDGDYARRLALSEICCVTSGDYERYFTVDGVRYHHIIDPDTRMPANYFSSVTVLVSDSGLADALSTALFCMSYEDGLALVEKIGEVDVLWIRRDGIQLCTAGIEAMTQVP